MKRQQITFETLGGYLAEALKDPEFQEAWEASEPTTEELQALVPGYKERILAGVLAEIERRAQAVLRIAGRFF